MHSFDSARLQPTDSGHWQGDTSTHRTHRTEERHRNKPTNLHNRFLTEVQSQFLE